MPVSRSGHASGVLPVFAGVLAGAMLACSVAAADERGATRGVTKEECVAANEGAQDLQRSGKLIEAHAKLLLCADRSCPRVVRQDCADRMRTVEKSTPTVVLVTADADGVALTDAALTVDGVARADSLDGTPLQIDPGAHTLTVMARGHVPATLRLSLAEGDEVRRDVVLKSAAPAPRPEGSDEQAAPGAATGAVSAHRGGSSVARWIGWSAVGAGAASAVLGTVFGVLSLDDHAALTRGCSGSGSCPATPTYYDDITNQHDHAVAADLAFGIAVLAAGAGTVLLIAFPAPSDEAPARAAVRLQPWVGLGSAGMTGSFR